MKINNFIVSALAALVLATPAIAQDGSFPVERLRPAMDREGIIDVESAKVSPHLKYDLGLWFNYNRNALVVNSVDGSVLTREGALVANRIGANLTGAIGLFEWVEIGLDLPLILNQSRDPNVGNLVADAQVDLASSFGLGDLRLSPKIRLLRAEDAFVDLALLTTVTLPTNFPKNAFFGEGQNAFGGFSFAPELALSRDFGALKAALNLGYRLRGESQLGDLTVGPEVFYRVGAAYDLGETVDIPLELGVSVGGQNGTTDFLNNINSSPLEVLGSVTYNLGDRLQLFAGGGAGIFAGYSTPDFRVFGGARYSPRSNDSDGDGIKDSADGCKDDPEDKDGFEDSDGCPDIDNDQDGIFDATDKCINDAEDVDNFEDEDGCPDADNDQDGILDAADKCPVDAEDKDNFEDEDGCKDPDNDGDGTLDTDDKCPLVAGVKEKQGCPNEDKDDDGILDNVDACPDVKGVASAKGCPDKDGDGVKDSADKCVDTAGDWHFAGCPDKDKDGIPEPQDQCPDKPENINGVKDDDGCPDKGKTKIKLTAKKIEILEKVYFDSGKAKIKARSFNLLSQVAAVLKTHPEITRVRIEGHTDSQGKDAFNMDLSNRRAKAVMDFVVKKGGNAKVMVAQGFGEEKPVGDNKTKMGREQNRRVEFVILEIDGKPVSTNQIESTK